MAASKQLIRVALDLSEQDFWRLQAPMFTDVPRSWDAKEGPRAFAEKAPVWSGR